MPLDSPTTWLEIGPLLINVDHIIRVEEKGEGSIITVQHGAEINVPNMPLETIEAVMAQRTTVLRIGPYLLNIDHLIMFSPKMDSDGCVAFMTGGVHVALPDVTYPEARGLLGLRVDTTATAPEDSN